jgi:hypothetical protein
VAATVIGLIQWATTTWSSQGRLVFSALPAISTLMVVGLVGWLPPRPARWTLAGLGGFMFLIAALAPFLWIRPAYTSLPTAQTPALAQPTVDYNFNDQIRLTGYEIEPNTYRLLLNSYLYSLAMPFGSTSPGKCWPPWSATGASFCI